MSIDEIADHFSDKYIKSLSMEKPEKLRSIIFQAVQAGMSDAYQRGWEAGKDHGEETGYAQACNLIR